MKKSLIILVALIVLFAMPAFASTPQPENTPTPTEEDTTFLGLEQLSEEQMLEIMGLAIVFEGVKLDQAIGFKTSDIIKIGTKTIIQTFEEVYMTGYDTIYLFYTPNGKLYSVLCVGFGGTAVIYIFTKDGTTSTTLTGTHIFNGYTIVY